MEHRRGLNSCKQSIKFYFKAPLTVQLVNLHHIVRGAFKMKTHRKKTSIKKMDRKCNTSEEISAQILKASVLTTCSLYPSVLFEF